MHGIILPPREAHAEKSHHGKWHRWRADDGIDIAQSLHPVGMLLPLENSRAVAAQRTDNGHHLVWGTDSLRQASASHPSMWRKAEKEGGKERKIRNGPCGAIIDAGYRSSSIEEPEEDINSNPTQGGYLLN